MLFWDDSLAFVALDDRLDEGGAELDAPVPFPVFGLLLPPFPFPLADLLLFGVALNFLLLDEADAIFSFFFISSWRLLLLVPRS